MAEPTVGADSARDNIVTFKPRPRPLRADVPPFDPNNSTRLRVWETIWDWGQAEVGHGRS